MTGLLLDQATLVVATSATLLLIAATCFYVAADAPSPPSARLWGRSCLAIALGLILKAADSTLSPGLPQAIGDLAIGAALILQAMALAPISRLADRVSRTLIVITFSHLLLVVQFGAIESSPMVRAVGAHVAMMAGFIALAVNGLRPLRPEQRRTGLILMAAYGVSALLHLVLAISRWQLGSFENAEHVSWAAFAAITLQVSIPVVLLAQTYRQLASQLSRSATVDPLTQAANRRGLADAWSMLQARARRGDDGWHVGVVMLDIDDFKSVNQKHGHATGDRILQIVVESMRSVARRYDTVSRFGGEEFCMLLPGVTIRQAQVVTERIRKRITDTARERAGVTLTLSAGITVANAGQTEMDKAIDAADQMLYTAKRDGRDRSRVDPDALRVIAGMTPAQRSGRADELGFPMV